MKLCDFLKLEYYKVIFNYEDVKKFIVDRRNIKFEL